MLHRRGVELVADPREKALTLKAIVAEDADLDELVRRQSDVDFVKHRDGKPVLSDADERVEVMGLRAECAAKARGQGRHRH